MAGSRIKMGGGSINALTKDTILRGKGEAITGIDYNNIVNNRLIFYGNEFIIQKSIINNDDITYSNIYFNSNLYYYKSDIDSNFQNKLIPELGIIINNNSNISVNFSDGGWTSNYTSNLIYTLSEKTGFGTSNPSSSIHIVDTNAKILIDNNIHSFELGYDTNYIFSLGNNEKHQLKIHTDASDNSLFIDQYSTTNIKNIVVSDLTNLTCNIKIDNKSLKDWLVEDNKIATQEYVNNKNFLTNDTNLLGKGSNITDLDYKNITFNKLIFNSPLKYDYENNTVDADLTLSGWTSNIITGNIYSSFKSKIGIGTSEPLATLHIGTTLYNRYNNNNDGTLIISKTDSDNIINKNFKIGYDDNFNFSFGNYNINDESIWTKQFYINNLAPEGSLRISDNGNININNSLNINSNLFIQKKIIFNNNYNLNIDNNYNFSIADNIFINNRLNTIGIGTDPDDNYKLIVNGDIKTLSNFYVKNIYADDITLSNLIVITDINVSNINTNSIISSNINNTNLITTQNINANIIVSSNNIRANIINARNINCSNIICSNNLNINRILTGNIINASNISISNILKSRFINVLSNLTVASNIITSNLNARNINVRNINSSNIETTNITINDQFLAKTINTDFINNNNNILTNKLFSSNIDTLYIECSNINASNINIIDTIKANNINSSYIINNNKILSDNIETTNDIICNASITSRSIYSANIYISDKIGINTLEPLSELHICNNNSTNTNTSIIITGINNSFKIGYDNSDQFLLGSFDTVSRSWKQHISINNNAPDNVLTIKNSGNISIGNDQNINDLYKLNVIGDINAINIYENGVKILNNNAINNIINTKLVPYLTINDAENIYMSKYDVENSIDQSLNIMEDLVASLFSKNSNIYTSQKKYPYGTIYDYDTTVVNNLASLQYYESSNIYGIKEQFSETIINNDNTETILNYTIYYSSAIIKNGYFILNKYYIFLYGDKYNNLRNSISWGSENYYIYYNITDQNIFDLNKNKIIKPNNTISNSDVYYGDFIIIKYDFDLVLSKFRFYVINSINNYKIPNAPALWKCYGSNDANIWTEIIVASNDILDNALNFNSYIDSFDGYAYYERHVNFDIPYRFFGFVFNKIVHFNKLKPALNNTNKGLELFRIELYGKKPISTIYISSNVLNQYLYNYAKNDYITNNMQTKINCTFPLVINGNNISLDSSFVVDSNAQPGLSNLIVNYIESKIDIWSRNENKIYYISGSVGIGTTDPNPNLIPDLKLNVNGSIITSNINNIGNIYNIGNITTSQNITAFKYFGDGSSLTNINYNNIVGSSKPNFENLNNWNIFINKVLNASNCYYSLNGNVGVGYNIGDSLISKLSIKGNIHSTGVINAMNNLQENNINISDKYLNINGGTITGFIGIGTSISDIYRVNINGNLNTTSLYINGVLINFQNYVSLSYLNSFIENYLTITDLNNRLLLYSKTGEDPNYLKLTNGIVETDITFLRNIFTSNLISSNINVLNELTTPNLISSNINVFNQLTTSNLISSNINVLNQILTPNLISSNINVLNQLSTPNLISSNINVLNQLSTPNLISSNINVLNQLSTSNLISSNLISSNINVLNQLSTPTLISSNINVLNQLTSSNVISSNINVLNQLITSNLISSNINALNQISTSNLISSNINALNQISTSNVISSNINALNQISTSNVISSNINALNQITTPNLISSNINALNQITSSNVISSNINALNQLTSSNLISSNINALNQITTSNLISSNINALNLISSNINALNQISTSNLISSNINSLNLISSNINILNQISTSNLISSNINSLNLISSNINSINLISSNLNVFNQLSTSNLISSNINALNQISTSNLISSNINVLNQLSTPNLISSNINALNQLTSSNLISSNINALNLISSNLISSNINVLNQLTSSNLISSNINVLNLISSNLISSNINALNQISTSNLISSNINVLNLISSNLISSNINVFNQLTTSNLISSNIRVLHQIATSNLISSNINALNQISTSNLISSNINALNQLTTSNLISSNIRVLVQISTSNLISSNINALNQISTSNLISLNNFVDNINSSNIYNSNLLSSYSIYNINNVGIGDNPSSLYKLNVKGNIYSSNDIICDGNIKENGFFLKDKYLSINDATNFINTDVLRNELSSNQPNVQKKYGFRCICNKAIILNNETYYKHDVDLSVYIKSKIDSIDANPYRIFGLKCFSTSAIFNNTVANKPPNILQYDIYTSHIINTNTINICAIGFPSNYYLNRITAGDIFILKTNNYNYISILSRTPNLSISCIISDFLF